MPILSRLSLEEGIELRYSSSAKEVILLIKDGGIRVAILDRRFPDMNGS